MMLELGKVFSKEIKSMAGFLLQVRFNVRRPRVRHYS